MHADAKPRRGDRWIVLGAYLLVAGASQMLWLNFAPILTRVEARYGVSELVASLLVLVFPLLYVVFSLPAGAMTDARGYRFTVGLGAIGMAVASVVRIADSSFWALMIGQTGIAIAQPYVMNGISKLVAEWFPEDEAAMATGLGTMGMFLGMAAGMAATPPLVEALGMRGAMVAFAGFAAFAAIAFVLAARRSPPADAAPSATISGEAAPALAGFRPLLANRGLVLVFVLAFLGLGFFNGVTTWLEPILAPHGVSSEDAGLVGGVMIVGGIAGAVVIPLLSDKLRRRKPFLVLCAAAALALAYPLCENGSRPLLLALGAALGFFFLPAFALLLEMSAQLAGPERTGAATSLLMLAGNAGGVVVILAVPAVKGTAPTYHPAVLFLTALLFVTTLLAAFAPETFARSSSGA